MFGYVVAEFAVCVIADDGTSSSSMLIVDAPDARPYTATALEISKAPAVVSSKAKLKSAPRSGSRASRSGKGHRADALHASASLTKQQRVSRPSAPQYLESIGFPQLVEAFTPVERRVLRFLTEKLNGDSKRIFSLWGRLVAGMAQVSGPYKDCIRVKTQAQLDQQVALIRATDRAFELKIFEARSDAQKNIARATFQPILRRSAQVPAVMASIQQLVSAGALPASATSMNHVNAVFSNVNTVIFQLAANAQAAVAAYSSPDKPSAYSASASASSNKSTEGAPAIASASSAAEEPRQKRKRTATFTEAEDLLFDQLVKKHKISGGIAFAGLQKEWVAQASERPDIRLRDVENLRRHFKHLRDGPQVKAQRKRKRTGAAATLASAQASNSFSADAPSVSASSMSVDCPESVASIAAPAQSVPSAPNQPKNVIWSDELEARVIALGEAALRHVVVPAAKDKQAWTADELAVLDFLRAKHPKAGPAEIHEKFTLLRRKQKLLTPSAVIWHRTANQIKEKLRAKRDRSKSAGAVQLESGAAPG